MNNLIEIQDEDTVDINRVEHTFQVEEWDDTPVIYHGGWYENSELKTEDRVYESRTIKDISITPEVSQEIKKEVIELLNNQ